MLPSAGVALRVHKTLPFPRAWERAREPPQPANRISPKSASDYTMRAGRVSLPSIFALESGGRG